MKKILQLCCFALLAVALQAKATYINVSKTTDITSTLKTAGAYDWKRDVLVASQYVGQGKNSFADKYTFTLATPFDASGLMTSVLLSNKGLVITGFDLYQSGGSLVAKGALNDIFDDWEQGWMFTSASTLAAGAYYVQVSGYATAVSGSYSGNVAVRAVPEPASLALMLGGIGMMGLVLRRRM